MPVVKRCTKCKELKSISQFYKQKTGMLGRTGECKVCRKVRSAKWASENREKKNATARRNKKDRSEYCKKWREENPDYYKWYREQRRKIDVPVDNS